MSTGGSKQSDQVSSPPMSGTRTIPRNRRGPMSRAMVNASLNESGLANERQRALRRHRKEKQLQSKGFRHKNLSTHMDDDDTEILIESSLGNYEGGLKETFAMKSRKFSFRRRNYAPLRGYDILSQEERDYFSIPSPDSIFEIPEFLNDPKNRLRLYKTIMVLLGVSVYFLMVTVVKKLYHFDYGKVMPPAIHPPKPKEIDIDITNLTISNVFKDDIEHKIIEQDKTLDMGYGEDDMILEVKKKEEKHESVTFEDLHDDYVGDEENESTNDTKEITSAGNKNETIKSEAIVKELSPTTPDEERNR